MNRGDGHPNTIVSQKLSALFFGISFDVLQGALYALQDYSATRLRSLYREKFNLLWILHSMNRNQKAGRVTLSYELLEVLKNENE
jgi:hypothetical protein